MEYLRRLWGAITGKEGPQAPPPADPPAAPVTDPKLGPQLKPRAPFGPGATPPPAAPPPPKGGGPAARLEHRLLGVPYPDDPFPEDNVMGADVRRVLAEQFLRDTLATPVHSDAEVQAYIDADDEDPDQLTRAW